jgi:putative salt-induced outer membrane protein YdiY
MRRSLTTGLIPALFSVFLASTSTFAQAPAPTGPWTTETASAGLAFTQGNKDSSSINMGYEVVYDPKTRNLVKSDGLFLYGKTDGEKTADRLGLNARDEYQLGGRSYAYGQLQYLRDDFKNIEYLLAPTAGVGYRVVDTASTKFSVDAGLGGVWEKAPGASVSKSGAVTFGDKLSRKITANTAISQTFTALYKTSDFSDSLYSFGAALTTSMSAHSQLKVEVLDVYKNLAPTPFNKNDVALVIGFVFKR